MPAAKPLIYTIVNYRSDQFPEKEPVLGLPINHALHHCRTWIHATHVLTLFMAKFPVTLYIQVLKNLDCETTCGLCIIAPLQTEALGGPV